MFTRTDPHVRAGKALRVFRQALSELEKAVEDHKEIAAESRRLSNELALDAAQHESAAGNHSRRINKIAEFLA